MTDECRRDLARIPWMLGLENVIFTPNAGSELFRQSGEKPECSSTTQAHSVTNSGRQLFRFRPNSRRLVVFKELNVQHIGIAADGAVFGVLLVLSFGGVDGDDDRFAAGGAGVGRLIGGAFAFAAFFLHG